MKSVLQKLPIFFLSMVLCFSFSTPSFAAVEYEKSPLYENLNDVQTKSSLTGTDVRIVIARLIRIALGAVGLILVCIILYAGFLYMTAGGNEDQIDKSKKFIKNAVIGLVITMSAWAITNFVISSIQGATNWVKIF